MDRIKDKIVCIMSHGKSIEKLEDYIDKFKDKNICWMSFNYWELMEKFILSKINKKLDVVLDCAETPNWEYGEIDNIRNFERKIRIPNIIKLIKRGTLIVSTLSLIREKYPILFDNTIFYDWYKDKILFLDNLNIFFPNMPLNSLSRLLAVALIGKPKKIIIFGLDGHLKKTRGLETYYKPKLWLERKKLLNEVEMKNKFKFMLRDDTINIQNKYLEYITKVCKENKVSIPPIINCSPDSKITIFKNINYEDLSI